MKTYILFFLTLALLLCGCSTPQPREIVFVLDVSQSIDADAEQQMFVAVEDVAQHLNRGDILTVIPITGNAVAELQGRTLQYAVPSADNRKAYDADLRSLNAKIKENLARLHASAVANPGKHTDVIGTVRFAMKGFSAKPSDKRLVVLSDFIQDDQQLNFQKDSRLASEGDAKVFAKGIALEAGDHASVHVVLGRLRSVDFSALPASRQRAIDAFWGVILSPASINPDGTAAALPESWTP